MLITVTILSAKCYLAMASKCVHFHKDLFCLHLYISTYDGGSRKLNWHSTSNLKGPAFAFQYNSTFFSTCKIWWLTVFMIKIWWLTVFMIGQLVSMSMSKWPSFEEYWGQIRIAGEKRVVAG